MNAIELRPIISEVLVRINKWSLPAVNIMLGTAAHESGGFRWRRQHGGPALGLFQIEPVTHDSVRTEWHRTHPDLIAVIDSYLIPGHDAVDQLVDNDHYAAGICRLKYAGIAASLPAADDLPGMAAYYKKYYNAGGRGTEQEFIDDYRRYVGPADQVS